MLSFPLSYTTPVAPRSAVLREIRPTGPEALCQRAAATPYRPPAVHVRDVAPMQTDATSRFCDIDSASF